MKILISPVTETSVSDCVINDLRGAGTQFHVQRVDRKIVFLAPITWAGMSNTEWVVSALINNDEKTVLLRAETQEEVPESKMREVTRALKRMNRKGLDGQFSLVDGDHSVMYAVGPFVYDSGNPVLWNAVEKMADVVQQVFSTVTEGMSRRVGQEVVGRSG